MVKRERGMRSSGFYTVALFPRKTRNFLFLLPMCCQCFRLRFMRSKVILLARVKQGDKYPFVTVPIKRGHPAPVDGATCYYLRFTENGRRRTKSAGPDLHRAFVEYQNRELAISRAERGLLPIDGLPLDSKRPSNDRIRVAEAVLQYIANIEDAVRMGEKSKGTLRGYRNAVVDFRDNCGVEYLDQITGETLRRHKLWLCENMQKRIRGKQLNTVAKRFRFLNTFLTKFGIQMVRYKLGDQGLLERSEVPQEEKKPSIDKYSIEEINGMLSVATVDEADLIQFFLRTGCRDEEAAYLTWKDVDFKRGQIVICEKEGVWKPKDKEERVIPLEDGVLLARLEDRRKRQTPKNDLVFPNSRGTPDMHLIRQLHKVVEKMKEKGLEIEGVPTLHRFRRTYASMMISHSDLQTVSSLLGHSDIETTALYLAPDQSRARMGTRTAFKEIRD